MWTKTLGSRISTTKNGAAGTYRILSLILLSYLLALFLCSTWTVPDTHKDKIFNSKEKETEEESHTNTHTEMNMSTDEMNTTMDAIDDIASAASIHYIGKHSHLNNENENENEIENEIESANVHVEALLLTRPGSTCLRNIDGKDLVITAEDLTDARDRQVVLSQVSLSLSLILSGFLFSFTLFSFSFSLSFSRLSFSLAVHKLLLHHHSAVGSQCAATRLQRCHHRDTEKDSEH